MDVLRKLLVVPLLLGSAVVLSSCGGGNTSATPVVPVNGPGDGGSSPTSIPRVQHVAVLVLENTNYADVVASTNAPYLNSLVSKGALAAKYFANSHPSIPNYFEMTTGLTVTNDDSFTGVVSSDNVVRQLAAAGKSWKVYAESLPAAGYLGGDRGLYLRHHDPFTYFSDIQGDGTLAANVVPFSQMNLDRSSGSLPAYSFIIPNAADDAHSCPDGTTGNCSAASRLRAADAWVQSNVAPLLADSSFQSSGLLIVVFDESADDSTSGGGRVFAALVGTHVKPGYVGNTTSYDHRSLLSLTLHALGLTAIPNGADAAPEMSEFFQ